MLSFSPLLSKSEKKQCKTESKQVPVATFKYYMATMLDNARFEAVRKKPFLFNNEC